MKRKMAFFLAATLALQGQTVNAAEAGGGNAAGAGTGQVDVSIASGLILKKQNVHAWPEGGWFRRLHTADRRWHAGLGR